MDVRIGSRQNKKPNHTSKSENAQYAKLYDFRPCGMQLKEFSDSGLLTVAGLGTYHLQT